MKERTLFKNFGSWFNFAHIEEDKNGKRVTYYKTSSLKKKPKKTGSAYYSKDKLKYMDPENSLDFDEYCNTTNYGFLTGHNYGVNSYANKYINKSKHRLIYKEKK